MLLYVCSFYLSLSAEPSCHYANAPYAESMKRQCRETKGCEIFADYKLPDEKFRRVEIRYNDLLPRWRP